MFLRRNVLLSSTPAAGVEAARRAGMPSIGVRAKEDALEANVFTRSMVKLGDRAFDRLLDDTAKAGFLKVETNL